jgi:glycosyltransferase involved in cell wall biosynthesis
MAQPVCSVVIPTYNAAHIIGDQLGALSAQLDAPIFEVIVADNGSTDDLVNVLASWAQRLPLLRRVDASRAKGVSVARNEGIRAAATDKILICDADDLVSPGWVRSFSSALADHAFVGGPVETSRLSGPSAAWVPIPERTQELLESWEGLKFPSGGNLGLHRRVWEAVGGFAEDYPAGAEEIDFAWRARDAGYPAAYVPEALLHYRIRTSLKGVLRQQYNSGRGTATLFSKWRPQEVPVKSLLVVSTTNFCCWAASPSAVGPTPDEGG